jgi:hypothetical protein
LSFQNEGVKGEIGQTGLKGSIGIQGLRGEAGAVGPAGVAGPIVCWIIFYFKGENIAINKIYLAKKNHILS